MHPKLALCATLCLSALPGFASESHALSEEALAKESQNPIGNLISVPFENTVYFDIGPSDSMVFASTMKPVYPLNFGDINLINRFILPYIYAEGQDAKDLQGLVPDDGDGGFDTGFSSTLKAAAGSAKGFGDLTYQGFFTPAHPGTILWGLGPALTLPTHTEDRFGSDKVSAGPAIVALAKPGKWLLGALLQHQWDVAGSSGAADVNKSSLQLFVNYNLSDGWYLTSAPTFTANWEADSDNRWKVPVGGGIGKLHRFGKLPIDFKLTGYSNVKQSDFGPDYEIMFSVKFIFPK